MKKKRDDGIPVREACVKKWFLVMKLICVFTLFLLLKVSANGFSQKKISLDFEKASMLEIIQELRQQTGYKFFFNHNELKKVLASYEIPRCIYVRKQLPKNDSGKIIKDKLHPD